eukprot:5495707-Amphidinium_carterae.1
MFGSESGSPQRRTVQQDAASAREASLQMLVCTKLKQTTQCSGGTCKVSSKRNMPNQTIEFDASMRASVRPLVPAVYF